MDPELLQSVFDNAEAATVILREDGVIVKVNNRFVSLCGESKGDIEGNRVFLDYIPADQQAEVQEYLMQPGTEENGPHVRKEIELVAKNGVVTMLMTLFQLDQPGIRGISLVDITDRKAHEQALEREKEKAQNSERLKSAFLANMSHEIRTPINSIVGFADLLRLQDLSPEKRALYVDQVINGSNDLLMLIEKITTIARLDSGQFKISNREFDLNAKMADIETKFQEELINRKKAHIQLKFSPPDPGNEFMVTADPMRLSEVLSNLLENALKFTESGTIEFGYQLQQEEGGNEVLQFFVKDTGLGIDPSNEHAIFERFVKFIEKEETIFKGAGLGLAICKGIVELSGGRIWVESRKGEGAQFYFTYPLAQHHRRKLPGAGDEPAGNALMDWHMKEVLIAEDAESNYLFIKELISPTRIRVLRARDGMEAVELFQNNPSIDIVIMDVLMPKMDGYEATRKIREIKPDIPVIAQSAFTFEGDIQDGLYAGCFNDYVMKPYTRKVLLAVISKYLSVKQS